MQATLADKKKLFGLTWPIFLEAILYSIIGSIDTLMISSYADNAVGALGSVNQVLSLFQVLSNIITTGSGILCAQYIGAGKSTKEKQPLVLSALLVNGILGALFSVAALAGSDLLLTIMRVPESQYAYAKSYLSIVGGFLIVQMIAMTFNVVIRSHGKTRSTMIFSVGMNLINVVLNYMLIYGRLGAPELGVSGAAIATVISKCIACVAAGVYLFGFVMKGMSLRPHWRMMKDSTGKILALGAPAAGEQISYTLSKIVVMAMVNGLGAVAANTYSYVNIVVSYVYLFSMAIGQGTSIMVGWKAGKKEVDSAKSICAFATRCSFLISLVTLGVLCLFRRQMMDIFTDNPEIIALGAAVILADFVLEAGRSRNLVLVNSLRATGDVRFPLYIGLFSMWFFSVGVSWVLHLHFGLVGIWIGLGLDECFRAVGMQIRWQKGTWVRYITGEEPQKTRKKKKWLIPVVALAVVVALIVGGCAIYLGDYYRADRTAIAAFAQNCDVEMEDTGDTLVWKPEGATTGLIFYPGGKVEHSAYAPLMQACAQRGILCVVVEMPFRLAVLDVNAAKGIQARYPHIENWYMGGHSLGGAMAASYLSKHTEEFDGLVLLGGYSTANLSDSDLRILSVYGSEDKVMDREKYDKNRNNLPAEFEQVIIEGGCHAGFGMYGPQDGDGKPTISTEEQITQTANIIATFVQV